MRYIIACLILVSHGYTHKPVSRIITVTPLKQWLRRYFRICPGQREFLSLRFKLTNNPFKTILKERSLRSETIFKTILLNFNQLDVCPLYQFTWLLLSREPTRWQSTLKKSPFVLKHRKTMLGKILGQSSLLTVGFSGILGENPAVGILEIKHCNRTSKMRPIHYRVASITIHGRRWVVHFIGPTLTRTLNLRLETHWIISVKQLNQSALLKRDLPGQWFNLCFLPVVTLIGSVSFQLETFFLKNFLTPKAKFFSLPCYSLLSAVSHFNLRLFSWKPLSL